MTLKQELKATFLQRLDDKIEALQDIVEDLATDAQSDAKSSAGDKHETALSMMHLEQENITKKIRESLELREVVKRIDEHKNSRVVEFGCVVKVNTVYLFLAAALPKVTIGDVSVLGVSMDAPIAKALLGRQIHDSFSFNNCDFTVNFLE
ncbi:hypothetical protein [Myroides fluvii]|uniref:hypothetical protein n=1 Tax=Myroides fluvii TaxID=2572594 RepID=UPI00131EC4C1|nr:hypothetical protein [Myroides fluvii]